MSFKECGKRALSWLREHRKAYVFLGLFYLLAYYPVYTADFLFRDDLRRASIGFRGWGYGRYLSLLGSVLLHTDTYLADISPLPQLLCALIMALASLVLLAAFESAWRGEKGEKGFEVGRKKKEEIGNIEKLESIEMGETERIRMEKTQTKIPLSFLIAAGLLGLYPPFFNCVCYKYDAPYMALSVLFGIAPLFFYRFGARRFLYGFLCFLCTLGVCLTYQASSGLLPLLVAFFMFLRWGRGEKASSVFRFALVSALGYVAGLFFFRLFLMPREDTYVTMGAVKGKDFLPQVLENLRTYGVRFLVEMRPLWMGAMLLLAFTFLVLFAIRAKRKPYVVFPLGLLCLPLWALLSLGAYPYLQKPLFLPRAMYGMGALLALLGFGTLMGTWEALVEREAFVEREKKGKRTSQRVSRWLYRGMTLLIFCLVWMFLVFSFTLGNALSAQAEYTRFRMAEVVEDLSSLPEAQEGSLTVQLKGDIGVAPSIENLPPGYGMVTRIVPYTLKGGYIWGEYGFFHYYGLPDVKKGEGLSKKELPLLSETLYHRIYGKDGSFLIELKRGGAGRGK